MNGRGFVCDCVDCDVCNAFAYGLMWPPGEYDRHLSCSDAHCDTDVDDVDYLAPPRAHAHKWVGVEVVRRMSDEGRRPIRDYVIQSCECGEVRRVEVPR